MEYAAGGELFERICSAGRFSEDEVSLYVFFDTISLISMLMGIIRIDLPAVCLFVVTLPRGRQDFSSSSSYLESVTATSWYILSFHSHFAL